MLAARCTVALQRTARLAPAAASIQSQRRTAFSNGRTFGRANPGQNPIWGGKKEEVVVTEPAWTPAPARERVGFGSAGADNRPPAHWGGEAVVDPEDVGDVKLEDPRIGWALGELSSPALLVDLDAMERNVQSLVDSTAAHSRVRLRPHAKAFKSTDLAWALGFRRLCAQTVTEAEAMVEAGCTDVLLTNQVVGHAKLIRLGVLATKATVGALVDCLEHIDMLRSAAAATGSTITAYIEVNAGQDRCGVEPGSDAAVELAQDIVRSRPELEFGGIQCYHGAIQHVRSAEERRQQVLDGPVARAKATMMKLSNAGLPCPVISGGGTGTFPFELEGGVHTELQPGSFLFMDGDYAANEDAMFEQSLFVHATVISADAATGRRVLDAGSKAIDLLAGVPALAALPGTTGPSAEVLAAIEYVVGNDEHTVLANVPDGVLPVGSTVQLVPAHCDPTVNLHPELIGMREGKVSEVFAINARGW